MLLAVEAVFALVALAGIWFVCWPAALIVGGVLGVLACERLAADRAARAPRATTEAAG